MLNGFDPTVQIHTRASLLLSGVKSGDWHWHGAADCCDDRRGSALINHNTLIRLMQGKILKDTKYSLFLLNQFYIQVIPCPQSRLPMSSSGRVWMEGVFSHLLGLKCWVFMVCRIELQTNFREVWSYIIMEKALIGAFSVIVIWKPDVKLMDRLQHYSAPTHHKYSTL